ncbi:hypothetical protein RND71_030008 [Anisodus tanguticus]|uniref:Uncharacterized protein n=1 Tax=Anisodus tanguticus TaxID=243964 RepID=A0AAE1V7S2_9SOLA|nr:hypothetical protein RND71_030008 [Anisodus tanguticus]
MVVYKEVSFLAYLLVLGMFILVRATDHDDHKKCTENVVILPTGYVHVQKGVRKIPYAPIVAQATMVATIIVLTELSFVKDSLTLGSQNLVLGIVMEKLSFQNVPFRKDRR